MVKIETPCINVCKLTADTKQCIGCYRFVDEITNWINMTDFDRMNIMSKLKEREHEEEKKRKDSIYTIRTE